MVEIKNYTPHEIIIKRGDDFIKYPSMGIARVSVSSHKVAELDGVDIVESSYGEVVGLPTEEDGVYYIVSALVKGASTRADLLVPDGTVRDDKGQVAYCTCWRR